MLLFNGAERARKSIERERSGDWAESAAHNPSNLTIDSLMTVNYIHNPHSAVNFQLSNSNIRESLSCSFITCVSSYAEARLSYRLDVRLSVCPFVRLSVTRWYCIKPYRHAFFTTPTHSSFVFIKIFPKFRRGHPLRGR